MALLYSHPSSLEHDTGAHPENAGRLRAVEGALERASRAGEIGLHRDDAPAAGREQLRTSMRSSRSASAAAG
jgi:hypothetical protein